MPPKKAKPQDDLQAENNLKRIDDLETFKGEYEGLKFYEKIDDALKKSKDIEKTLKEIIWDTIKGKLIWIILTGVGLIFVDLIIRAIPSILKAIGS